MYLKHKRNSNDYEQYLKQDGKWSTMVLIMTDYCAEIQSIKRDSFYTDECIEEDFEQCTESDFQIGLKKAMSILKSQLL